MIFRMLLQIEIEDGAGGEGLEQKLLVKIRAILDLGVVEN